MTLIETTGLLALAAEDDTSEHVCVDRSHVAVDRVCTTCKALHLPTMEGVRYCSCETPNVWIFTDRPSAGGAPGILSWQCQTCELPNLDVLRGRLPGGKADGTIPESEPCC